MNRVQSDQGVHISKFHKSRLDSYREKAQKNRTDSECPENY